MTRTTKIRWATRTFNPVVGCSKISRGCRFCYAERMAQQYGWTPEPWEERFAEVNVTLKPERLKQPYSWKAPASVFVCSVSDLFHRLVPDDYLNQVFAVMNDLPQHRWMCLTKRPERAATWHGPWSESMWLGTTIEDNRYVGRADHLRASFAPTKFISAEPLLGPLPSLDLTGVDWIIIGAESGGQRRPFDMAWAREIRDKAVAVGTAVFFKQGSGYRSEMHPFLTEIDGSCWSWEQYPDEITPPVKVHDMRTCELAKSEYERANPQGVLAL